jgi:DGQHR domain-containing protein
MKKNTSISLHGQVGTCGQQKVFLGFAPAQILHKCSFADILDEDTGNGYQRPFSRDHSRNFRQYIEIAGSSTIPLTFNLRPDLSHLWHLSRDRVGYSTLDIDTATPCLAQVDCQHRLGDMPDSKISFAFMCFIGLDIRAEMSMFNVINSKAKGLSSSLTDYHQTKLIADLAQEAPHLLIAKKLNEDPLSPWHRMVRYGGETTSGLMRRTSFRMLQTSVKKLVRQMRSVGITDLDRQYTTIVDFWYAVKESFEKEWEDHRHHLLTKGVGLYSLMELLGHLLSTRGSQPVGKAEFVRMLNPLVGSIDWRSDGLFADAGGKKGAHEVYSVLRKAIGDESSAC